MMHSITVSVDTFHQVSLCLRGKVESSHTVEPSDVILHYTAGRGRHSWAQWH